MAIVSRAHLEATGREIPGGQFDSGQALKLLRDVAGLDAKRAGTTIHVGFLEGTSQRVEAPAIARAIEVSLSMSAPLGLLVLPAAPEPSAALAELFAHVPHIVAHRVVDHVSEVRVVDAEDEDDLVLGSEDIGAGRGGARAPWRSLAMALGSVTISRTFIRRLEVFGDRDIPARGRPNHEDPPAFWTRARRARAP